MLKSLVFLYLFLVVLNLAYNSFFLNKELSTKEYILYIWVGDVVVSLVGIFAYRFLFLA